MGSCQGLWVGLGDCPPQVGGSHLYQSCFLRFFPLWAQVLTLPGGGGGGHGMGWAVCSSLGECLSLCVGSKEQVTPGGTESKKLSG